MRKDSFRHVSQPASDEANIGGRNLENVFEKLRPKIKCESCAHSNEDHTHEGKVWIIQESPVG